MQKLSLLVAAPLALALIGAAIAQQATAPVQPTPVKRTPVGKIEVPGSNYEVITAAASDAGEVRQFTWPRPGPDIDWPL
jgi:hypothetical protein